MGRSEMFLYAPVVALLLVLAGCGGSGSNMPPVSSDQAKQAFGATFTAAAGAESDCSIQVSSGPTTTTYRNADGTIFAEVPNGNVFPMTIKVSLVNYVDGTSGYTSSGSISVTVNDAAGTSGSMSLNLNLSHATLPVQRIAGSLSFDLNAKTLTGKIQFNNDTYEFSEFSAP